MKKKIFLIILIVVILVLIIIGAVFLVRKFFIITKQNTNKKNKIVIIETKVSIIIICIYPNVKPELIQLKEVIGIIIDIKGADIPIIKVKQANIPFGINIDIGTSELTFSDFSLRGFPKKEIEYNLEIVSITRVPTNANDAIVNTTGMNNVELFI